MSTCAYWVLQNGLNCSFWCPFTGAKGAIAIEARSDADMSQGKRKEEDSILKQHPQGPVLTLPLLTSTFKRHPSIGTQTDILSAALPLTQANSYPELCISCA